MPEQRLAVDYAWQHPNPSAIKKAGYEGAIRYLSHTTSKNITSAEVVALHKAGLWVGLVWETTANRAGEGAGAGADDAKAANQQADALGYPDDAVIFFAVDYDTTAATVRPYFSGAKQVSKRPVGVYGGIKVIDGRVATWRWQTAAWSGGKVSEHAHLYQRTSHTHKIGGSTDGWDENVVIKDVPLWSPNAGKTPAKKPAPAPAPEPAEPTRVSVARTALLKACDQLDEAWKVGPRRGFVKTRAKLIRSLVNGLPQK